MEIISHDRPDYPQVVEDEEREHVKLAFAGIGELTGARRWDDSASAPASTLAGCWSTRAASFTTATDAATNCPSGSNPATGILGHPLFARDAASLCATKSKRS